MTHHRYIINILILSASIMVLYACQSSEDVQKNINDIQWVTDDQGANVAVPINPKRVIGLAPSITEFLFKICPDSMIVGRTQNCDYPGQVSELPVVNTYPLDQEALLELKPDLVIALGNINSPQDVARMRELGLNVFVLETRTLDSVYAAYDKIGKITGCENSAADAKESFFLQMDKYAFIRPGHGYQRNLKFLALASQTPIYVFGVNTIFTEKLKALRYYDNAIQESFASPYPEVNSEYILKCNPDVILGGDFEQLDSTFFEVYPILKETSAYKNRCVFEVNGDLMSRPGPRIPESVLELANIAKQACERIDNKKSTIAK